MSRTGIEIIRPANRAEWLAARQQDITASQIGALFGEHEYATAFSIWAVKTGRAPRDEGDNPAIQRGRLLERVAVDLLREQFPRWRIEHNAAENVYYRDPVARLGATPDVIVQAPERGKGVVQIKSVEASIYKRKWLDEDGNPEPPFWIALQATLEAHLVPGATWAAVAPLVVGHGLEMPLIDIPLDHMDGVISAMKAKAAEFWQMVAEGREPIPDYTRDGATIEAMYGSGDPEHEIDLTADNRIPDLIAARRVLARDVADARRQIETIDTEIKAKLGEAHVAHLPGGRKVTWKPQKRDGFFVQPTTVRALNLPKEKD